MYKPLKLPYNWFSWATHNMAGYGLKQPNKKIWLKSKTKTKYVVEFYLQTSAWASALTSFTILPSPSTSYLDFCLCNSRDFFRAAGTWKELRYCPGGQINTQFVITGKSKLSIWSSCRNLKRQVCVEVKSPYQL